MIKKIMALVLSSALCCGGTSLVLATQKKLIEIHKDPPTPIYIQKNIQEIERRPFDGITIRLSHKSGLVFSCITKWKEVDFEKDFSALRGISWNTFTDNFIEVSTAYSNMDWFNEDDWEAITHNSAICAKAAKVGNCKGILFDPEPHDEINPWKYVIQRHSESKSFEEYETMVRRRGAEFMYAIQKQVPNIMVFTLFGLSICESLFEGNYPIEHLEQHPFGLLPAFLNGMMDVAGPEVIIIDGNKKSSLFVEPLDFFVSYHTIRRKVLSLVQQSNTDCYLSKTQVSYTVSIDNVFGYFKKGIGLTLSPRERAELFARNIYYGLLVTDKYVSCYTETIKFLDSLPPGFEEAIAKAQAKLYNTNIDLNLQHLLSERPKIELIKRTGIIKRLLGDKPKVDGILDDDIWQGLEFLNPFLHFVGFETETKITTSTQISYDNENLYIAFRCKEPNISRMLINDEKAWARDSLSIFISPNEIGIPYYRLTLNPNNTRWAFKCLDSRVKEEIPIHLYWISEVKINEQEWFAEVAIPWLELKITPKAGMILRANLCRQRIMNDEETMWSQAIRDFSEFESFGNLVIE